MNKYELYMQLDKWYRIQAIKILPTYLWERISQHAKFFIARTLYML